MYEYLYSPDLADVVGSTLYFSATSTSDNLVFEVGKLYIFSKKSCEVFTPKKLFSNRDIEFLIFFLMNYKLILILILSILT